MYNANKSGCTESQIILNLVFNKQFCKNKVSNAETEKSFFFPFCVYAYFEYLVGKLDQGYDSAEDCVASASSIGIRD